MKDKCHLISIDGARATRMIGPPSLNDGLPSVSLAGGEVVSLISVQLAWEAKDDCMWKGEGVQLCDRCGRAMITATCRHCWEAAQPKVEKWAETFTLPGER